MVLCMTISPKFLSVMAALVLVLSACSGSEAQTPGEEGVVEEEPATAEEFAELQVSSSVTCERSAEGSNIFDLSITNETDIVWMAAIDVTMFDAAGVIVHETVVEAAIAAETSSSTAVRPPTDAGDIASCEAIPA